MSSFAKSRKPLYKKVTLNIDMATFLSIANTAKSECRTVSQQALYFMLIGKELIDQQLEETDKDLPAEIKSSDEPEEERTPAIGFLVNREDD